MYIANCCFKKYFKYIYTFTKTGCYVTRNKTYLPPVLYGFKHPIFVAGWFYRSVSYSNTLYTYFTQLVHKGARWYAALMTMSYHFVKCLPTKFLYSEFL